MNDNSTASLEFDRFEDTRRTLADVLIAEGHELIEAEKIALYVVEGMREVPRLTSLLANYDANQREEILFTLRKLLANSHAFEKARFLLGWVDEEGA